MSTAQTQTELKKPIRPLTAYHLFFQLEREWILQNIESPDDNEQLDARPVGKELDAEMPTRYQNIHLSPTWYVSASGKRKRTKESDQKRKHRKSHGKISFQELSRRVASRWANLEETDNETKMYSAKIAKRELHDYKEKVKVYKAQVAVLEKENHKKPGSMLSPVVSPKMTSVAHLPPGSPTKSIHSQTGNTNTIESPGVVSISMSGSTSNLSPSFRQDQMKQSYLNLAENAIAGATSNENTTEQADFSFIPLPKSLQEKEDSFLKQCQKKARYTSPISFSLGQYIPSPGRHNDDIQERAGITDVVFDSSMRDLGTHHSNETGSEPDARGRTRKRSACDMSCGSMSPLQCYGDSFIQTEYNFTEDDAEMLLKALF